MARLGDKVGGKAKEIKGKLTDDEATELEGKAQQATGEIKDPADDVADEMRDRRGPRIVARPAARLAAGSTARYGESLPARRRFHVGGTPARP